jgi:putative Mn2+ efflux pump MntP
VSVLAVLTIAVALSMDNFALALAMGATQPRTWAWTSLLRLPLVFGACQVVAPVVGWLIGAQAAGMLRGYGSIVAFLTLAFVGWRMLRSAWVAGGDALPEAPSFAATIALGIATSVDSLAVGFGLAMTDANIAVAAALIGLVTAVLTLAGVVLGKRLGPRLGAQSKVIAGIVLVVLGLRMLLPHR